MFNKLKQFKDLRSQAKTMQNALAGESVKVEKRGVSITINGNLEVTNITIEDGLSGKNLESTLTELFNEAVKKYSALWLKKCSKWVECHNFKIYNKIFSL